MKPKILTKPDAKHCKAEIYALPVFICNVQTKCWSGKVNFTDRGLRLFSTTSEIVRTSYEDAAKDAENIARDNGF